MTTYENNEDDIEKHDITCKESYQITITKTLQIKIPTIKSQSLA